MIEMEFEVVSSKIISSVKLKSKNSRPARSYDAIFDTGSTMTTMSKELFKTLGYLYKDTCGIKIIGINGESKGTSTVIDYFEIGGVNIGPVRIAVGELAKEFRNSIVIGMNVIVWYNLALSYFTNKITLVERQFRGRTLKDKFTMKDITSYSLLSSIEEIPCDAILIRQDANALELPLTPSTYFKQ